jgi:hypothetical protein
MVSRRVFRLRVWLYGAWHMWARSGHIIWHMMTLDTETWQRGVIHGLGLTDEDVGLIRMVDCDIMVFNGW